MMASNLPVREHGFMIKNNGVCWGRTIRRGAAGWCLYATKRGAEKEAGRYIGATVVSVTLTIEENKP
jgi:hypothetical protein